MIRLESYNGFIILIDFGVVLHLGAGTGAQCMPRVGREARSLTSLNGLPYVSEAT